MNTAITLSPVDQDSRKKLDIHSGDTVRVWSKIQEKGKTRLQAFEGIVLARKHGTELGGTVTVRKVSNGVGVERVFPLYSPLIDKIEIVKKVKTRRSKLYYIRDKAAKEIRKKMKAIFRMAMKDDTESSEEIEEEVLDSAESSDVVMEDTPIETEIIETENTPEETKSE